MKKTILTLAFMLSGLCLWAQNCDSAFVETFLSSYNDWKASFDRKVWRHVPREYRDCDILYEFDVTTRKPEKGRLYKAEDLFCDLDLKDVFSWTAILHKDGIVKAELYYSSALKLCNFYEHFQSTQFEGLIKLKPDVIFWYTSWAQVYFFIKDHQLMALVEVDDYENEIKTAKEFWDNDFKKYYYELGMGFRIPRDTIEARVRNGKNTPQK